MITFSLSLGTLFIFHMHDIYNWMSSCSNYHHFNLTNILLFVGEKLPYTKNHLKNDTQMPQYTSSDIKKCAFSWRLILIELQINND